MHPQRRPLPPIDATCRALAAGSAYSHRPGRLPIRSSEMGPPGAVTWLPAVGTEHRSSPTATRPSWVWGRPTHPRAARVPRTSGRLALKIHRAEWPYGVSDSQPTVNRSHSNTAIQFNSIQPRIIRLRAYNQQPIDFNSSTQQHTVNGHSIQGVRSTVTRLQSFDSTAHSQGSFE